MSVFYNTLDYTLSEEEPKMTVDILIGAIGGHLHLFMGMSLLSFVEIYLLIGKFVNIQIYYNLIKPLCCKK